MTEAAIRLLGGVVVIHLHLQPLYYHDQQLPVVNVSLKPQETWLLAGQSSFLPKQSKRLSQLICRNIMYSFMFGVEI